MDTERARRLAAAEGLQRLDDKQLAQLATAIDTGEALARALPKDLHWTEESALMLRLPVPTRSAP